MGCLLHLGCFIWSWKHACWMTDDWAFRLPCDAWTHCGKVEWFNTLTLSTMYDMQASWCGCLSWNAERLNQ
jgi:hypothetical protein